MKRKYNVKNYGRFQKISKVIKENGVKRLYSSNGNKNFGVSVVNHTFARPIKEFTNKAAYGLTSLLYNPKKDRPYKGTIINLIFSFLITLAIIKFVASIFH